MTDALEHLRPEDPFVVPADHQRGIAVVGAGAIVRTAHLPAYRAARLDVRGIYDQDADSAGITAAEFALPKAYASLDELLGDPAVEVVDIAVPASAQPGIAIAAIGAGKHVLCQKPFALSVEEAQKVVAAAEQAGVKLAVNQQLRYEEAVAVARRLMDVGWIGVPLQISVTLRGLMDWSAWPWLADLKHIEIPYHSIHYLDVIRYFLGEPDLVWCVGGGVPSRTAPRAVTSTLSVLRFGTEGPRAYVDANHDVRLGGSGTTIHIDGSEGTARVSLRWPGPSSLDVWSPKIGGAQASYQPATTWLPDAFAGPMQSLLKAVADGGEPLPSGRDNLATLGLVEALHRAIDTGESQRPGSDG